VHFTAAYRCCSYFCDGGLSFTDESTDVTGGAGPGRARNAQGFLPGGDNPREESIVPLIVCRYAAGPILLPETA
jgi:hypothetical protein